MAPPDNPYASALDGLVIDDPVTALFDFCRERERIRMRREAGEPAPWSDDPIFQQGRFLNVFREDDRGSKAIHRFVKPVSQDLPRLVHALFFARWCNRQSTLDALSVEMLDDREALRRTLRERVPAPWCNVTAYPVGAVHWKGQVISRFDAATSLFPKIRGTLTDAIEGARGDAVEATRAVNALLGLDNDFPVFMAVIDIADLRPDVIDPASPVPTGIGAVAFADRLQSHLGLTDHAETFARIIELQPQLWPEARRSLQPIDVEYLSCECRKYFSYVNGTKTFTGKNRFRPGEPARIEFDVPAPPSPPRPVQTRIAVLAGGPCSGKSTLAQALAAAGHHVIPETSRGLLEAGLARGQSAEALRTDPIAWQREIMTRDHALFDALPIDEPVFTDTSVIEDIVFSRRAGLEPGPHLDAWLRTRRYATVFFLDPLDEHEQTEVRMESGDLSRRISDEVRACYAEYGYAPIAVPVGTVAERLAFVLSRLSHD